MALSSSLTLRCKSFRSKLTERISRPAGSRFGTTVAKSCEIKYISFKIFSGFHKRGYSKKNTRYINRNNNTEEGKQ